ncbi:MAG: ribulokinase [Candidatus Abyssobacteria bacterium SURF_17]|uniref:Ribulokinase n=1 Tax=Candidatus Abyssobacteria bacterium SURF_17 TaxID=2093361 RepID=A0A419EYU5_9BACT|nr:MAG: ribulokinase [Candidatus Abyssubacteria bacterium SURF_17]
MARTANRKLVLGVDVGTGSVRAGVFTLQGKMLGTGECPIDIFRPKPDFVEQSSKNIWDAAGRAIRQCLRSASAKPADVIGLSFDATCSLVALDRDAKPITVSPTGKANQNIIVWMDHRATDQADRINSTRHRVLRYVGGKLSPEQEPPKLLWIKENLPRTWCDAGKFFDLADFMVYAASGVDIRSLCTVVCKWTYLGHERKYGRWDMSFFKQVGLEDLFEGDKVGSVVRPMGTYAGPLAERAAKSLGLSPGIAVGVGIIDAHAGGVGVLGPALKQGGGEAGSLTDVLALIGGTSSCHMATTARPVFVKGVWGPYYGAMIPGMWLLEGGQSATGSLVDHVIADSAVGVQLASIAKKGGSTPYEILNVVVGRIKKRDQKGPEITKNLHVLPYYHGNRSPHADPYARGMVDGLSLDRSLENLALRYYATVQAIAYGTRNIIESLNAKGLSIKRIHACGGGTKNSLWLQEHADITGCDIMLPREPEAMLLGTAILAAVAAGAYPSVTEAMAAMGHSGKTVKADSSTSAYHDAKYSIFHKMYAYQLAHRKLMAGF